MNNFYKTNIDNIKISTISAYFYKNKEYSFTRINKIFLFLRYLSKHKKFFKTKNSVKHEILKNIEETCHNNTIKIALEQNINYDWKKTFLENKRFCSNFFEEKKFYTNYFKKNCKKKMIMNICNTER